MTVLSACQEAAKLLKPGQTVPPAIYSSSDAFAVELAVLANEAAASIAKGYDWQKLKVLKTQAGDGTTTAFALPTDYDRMPVKGNIFSTSFATPLERIDDTDEWLDREIRAFVGSIGYWIILGGFLNIKPVMGVSASAKYYYVSAHYAMAADGTTTKALFTLDTDLFRLPDRLLTLSLIWRWRHRKGLDYADDMENFEIAQAQEVGRDKGSRVHHVGRARLPDGITYAFPGVINAP